jgi:hypothetical protein
VKPPRRRWVVAYAPASPFVGPTARRLCWTRFGALAHALWFSRGGHRGELVVMTGQEYDLAWSLVRRRDYGVSLSAILRAGRVAGVYLVGTHGSGKTRVPFERPVRLVEHPERLSMADALHWWRCRWCGQGEVLPAETSVINEKRRCLGHEATCPDRPGASPGGRAEPS